jgi:hypothetical protein
MQKKDRHKFPSHCFRLGDAGIEKILLIHGSSDFEAFGIRYRLPQLDFVFDEGSGFFL